MSGAQHHLMFLHTHTANQSCRKKVRNTPYQDEQEKPIEKVNITLTVKKKMLGNQSIIAEQVLKVEFGAVRQ